MVCIVMLNVVVLNVVAPFPKNAQVEPFFSTILTRLQNKLERLSLASLICRDKFGKLLLGIGVARCSTTGRLLAYLQMLE
jgi:hypothetical protein